MTSVSRTNRPRHHADNTKKMPHLPIDIMRMILKPELIPRSQALGISRVNRDWYSLGQKLLWTEMTVQVGDFSTSLQQEAFLDQPNVRSFCTSLQVVFEFRANLSSPVDKNTKAISSEVERLGEILQRLSTLRFFGLVLVGSHDQFDLDVILSQISGFGHQVTHIRATNKKWSISQLDVLGRSLSLKYIHVKAEETTSPAQLDPILSPLQILYMEDIAVKTSPVPGRILDAAPDSLRSLILSGRASVITNIIGLLKKSSPIPFNRLETLDLRFQDTRLGAQMPRHLMLTAIGIGLPNELKILTIGPICYLPKEYPKDLEIWIADSFWGSLSKTTKLIVRFDPLLEQSGFPFNARQELEFFSTKYDVEVGIQMIKNEPIFPFSQP